VVLKGEMKLTFRGQKSTVRAAQSLIYRPIRLTSFRISVISGTSVKHMLACGAGRVLRCS
jgi:hypothetical protein